MTIIIMHLTVLICEAQRSAINIIIREETLAKSDARLVSGGDLGTRRCLQEDRSSVLAAAPSGTFHPELSGPRSGSLLSGSVPGEPRSSGTGEGAGARVQCVS